MAEVNGRPTFWFPVKQYGWGWGLPVRWQGWFVLAGYIALLGLGIYYFRAQRDIAAQLIYVFVLTVALVAIVAAKGEKPVGWRWGKK
jgi:uncharacterized membrane protein